MNFQEFPIASIVFEDDYRLLILQALSIDRLYELEALPEYTIILNGKDNQRLGKTLQHELFPRISVELRQKIMVLKWEDLLGDTPKTGYYDQQALKLSLGTYYKSDLYLMLDAKNHFTRPTSPSDFVHDGKPIMPLIETTDYWKRYLENSLTAMDNTEADTSIMLPSITPYLMYTDEVRATVKLLKSKYDPQITHALRASHGTEFLLYYAYIQPRLKSLYANVDQPVRTLFTVLPKEQKVALEYIKEVDMKSIPMFGLHRNRLKQLTVSQVHAIKHLWNKHLLSPWEDEDWFIEPQHLD